MKFLKNSGPQRKFPSRKTDKKNLKAATWVRSSTPPPGNRKKKRMKIESRSCILSTGSVEASEQPENYQPSVSPELFLLPNLGLIIL